MLLNINATLSEKRRVNEWKDTESVINWLKNIPNKHLFKFLIFYQGLLSINKKKLLWENIRFGKRYISIFDKNIEAVFHAKKFILCYNDDPCVKKRESNFEVIMGAYDILIDILCCHYLANALVRIILGCIVVTELLF